MSPCLSESCSARARASPLAIRGRGIDLGGHAFFRFLRRCHWVIEKGGKLAEAKLGVKPADDPKNAYVPPFALALAPGIIC